MGRCQQLAPGRQTAVPSSGDLRILANELHIHFESDAVSFHLGDQVQTLPAAVHVAADSSPPRVLAFGAGPGPGQASVRVDLFKPGAPVEGAPDKLAFLTEFLHHGMTSLWNRRFVAATPRVVVHGVGRLGPVMGGYEQGVVLAALHAAGANSVDFVAV